MIENEENSNTWWTMIIYENFFFFALNVFDLFLVIVIWSQNLMDLWNKLTLFIFDFPQRQFLFICLRKNCVYVS